MLEFVQNEVAAEHVFFFSSSSFLTCHQVPHGWEIAQAKNKQTHEKNTAQELCPCVKGPQPNTCKRILVLKAEHKLYIKLCERVVEETPLPSKLWM